MRVQVRFFSLFRERTGTGETALELERDATVDRALASLRERYPVLAPWTDAAERMVLVAVNRTYAGRGDVLHEGDELALFPPVSGG